jgi:hypothetical protein
VLLFVFVLVLARSMCGTAALGCAYFHTQILGI